MINQKLYVKEMKRNISLFAIFGGLLLMYGTIVSSMFSPDPDAANWMDAFIDLYPEMMGFIGFNVDNLTNYQSFIGGYLYGMLLLLFGLIFVILLINRLLFKYLDNGSFVYYLTAPNSRVKILMTQLAVILTYMFIFVTTIVLILGISGAINFPGYVDWPQLLYLNFSYFMLLNLIVAVSFAVVTIFEGRLASGLLTGLNVVLFVLKLISNLGSKYEFIKYLTPYSLFDVDKVLAYDVITIYHNVGLLLMSLLLYGVSIYVFKRKDLSL